MLTAGAQGHDVFVFIKLIITIGIGETMAAGAPPPFMFTQSAPWA